MTSTVPTKVHPDSLAGETLASFGAIVAELADALPDGLLVLDRDWRITYANPAARRISRIEPHHLNGPTHWELYPETLGTEVERVYRDAMLNRTARILEPIPYAPFNLWLSIQAVPVAGGLAVCYRDITTQKQQQDALRASEERYRILTELSPQCLWTADPAGRVLYANQRFLTYIGKDFVPHDGTEYLNCFFEADRERVLNVWTQSVTTGEDYDIEARLLRAADRAPRWWKLRASAVRDDAGNIQQWLGVASDIHDRRLDDDKLLNQYTEIDRQRREAEVIYRVSPIGMALYDAQNLRLLRINDRQAEIFGLTADDALGLTYEDLTAGVGTGLPLLVRARNGERILNHSLEGSLTRRPGEHRYWNVNYSPVFSEDGSVRAIATATIEITQQKRAEAALIQAEKLAAVGRMASSIAHEINNPLESVTNLLYIARTQATDPDMMAMLDLADAELRRVSIIANQTLRFHKQASNPREISCLDLYATVLSLYEGRLRNSSIWVEKRKRAERPVACFEGDIRQVLNNLVANAIDAMPNGGRLLVRSRESTDWSTNRRGLTLTIADTGNGMTAETQARIFEAFFTTKGINGTGLGLWISTGIMDRHQGYLRMRSSQREGHRGTVFTLFLPFETKPIEVIN